MFLFHHRFKMSVVSHSWDGVWGEDGFRWEAMVLWNQDHPRVPFRVPM